MLLMLFIAVTSPRKFFWHVSFVMVLAVYYDT